MKNSNFASLHAGMLMRGSNSKSNIDSNNNNSYGGGKVAEALVPKSAANTEPDFSRARDDVPPIRSLLERVADWTVLGDELDGDFSRRYSQARDGAGVSKRPVLDLWVAGQPIRHHSEASRLETGIIPPAAAPEKLKRKALTLRLEAESYSQLHKASDELGRSCQDILFSGMTRYLASLGFFKVVNSGD